MAILNEYPEFSHDPLKSDAENLQAFIHACAEKNGAQKNESGGLWISHHVVQIRSHYESTVIKRKLTIENLIGHTQNTITAYIEPVMAE